MRRDVNQLASGSHRAVNSAWSLWALYTLFPWTLRSVRSAWAEFESDFSARSYMASASLNCLHYLQVARLVFLVIYILRAFARAPPSLPTLVPTPRLQISFWLFWIFAAALGWLPAPSPHLVIW